MFKKNKKKKKNKVFKSTISKRKSGGLNEAELALLCSKIIPRNKKVKVIKTFNVNFMENFE